MRRRPRVQESPAPVVAGPARACRRRFFGQALDLLVRSDRRLTLGGLLSRVLPVILRLAFLVYPIVTNVAFEAFSCFEFEDGRSWLRTDVAIECETPPHTEAMRLAALAITVYPVGLFVLNAVLLFSARKAIRSGLETALSRPLRFLYAEYTATCFGGSLWRWGDGSSWYVGIMTVRFILMRRCLTPSSWLTPHTPLAPIQPTL